MSIILDALRRADAERERSRGTVPGLHDQVDLPAPVSRSVDDAADSAERRPPWTLLAVVAVLVLTALAWWLRTSQRPAPPAPVAVAEQPRPMPPPPAVLTAPPPAPAAVAVDPTPPPVVAPAARVATPLPPLRPAPAPKVADEAPAPPPAARALPRYQDLPGATRAELPTLTLGGAMVSDSPGGSVLVINDQLMREGDSVVPGLLLERIGPKSARLRWKDQRFELPY